MSNEYDIELQMNICDYGYKPKREKLKEIATSKQEFRAWATSQLDNFNDVAQRMDEWMDKKDE